MYVFVLSLIANCSYLVINNYTKSVNNEYPVSKSVDKPLFLEIGGPFFFLKSKGLNPGLLKAQT